MLSAGLPGLIVVFAQLCPIPCGFEPCKFPVFACQLFTDLNCDARDAVHCAPYDVDGSVYGDCVPDGIVDDYWRIIDVNLDDIFGCSDTAIMDPDGVADGIFLSPACDLPGLDAAQGSNGATLFLSDSTTVEVASSHFGGSTPFDLVRGNVAQLRFDLGNVDLGSVQCLAEDVSGPLLTFVSVQDVDTPGPGEFFFYVARWQPRIRDYRYPYGYGECKERIVISGNGDCGL